MPNLNKTPEQILSSLLTLGKEKVPSMLWAEYTPQHDILKTLSFEISRQTALLEYVKLISTLDGYTKITDNLIKRLADILELTTKEVLTLIEDDLDKYAEIWLVYRQQAKPARGTWKLYFESADNVNISKGTKFKTESGKIYKLDEELTNVTPKLIAGKYVVYAILESDGVGSTFNIPAGTIITAESSIAKFTSGEAFIHITSGRDKESNIHFVNRIRELRQSRLVGSKSWIKQLIKSHKAVYDCKVLSVGDSNFTRATTGADVWVYCESAPETNTDVRHEGILYFEKQPLVDDMPIVTDNVTFIRDTGDDAYSQFANDYAEVPASVSTVTYRTDSTIRALQEKINDSNYLIVGGRKTILVRRALRQKINIVFTYFLAPGYDATKVEALIKEDLLKFFTGGTSSYGEVFSRKEINKTTDKSDLIKVITNVDGVDRVDLSSFSAIRSDGADTTKDPIPVKFNEYHTLGTVNIIQGDKK